MREPGEQILQPLCPPTLLTPAGDARWSNPTRSQVAGRPVNASHKGQPFGAQSRVEKHQGWIWRSKQDIQPRRSLPSARPEMTARGVSVETMEFKEAVALWWRW